MKIALTLTTRVSSSPYPSRRCAVSKPRLPIFKLLSPPVKAGSARFGPDATRRSGHSIKLHMHSGLTRLVHQIRPSRFKRGTAPRRDPSNHGRRRQQITCSSVPQLCTAITTRLERRRFSSPPLLSSSGSTACFYQSSPTGSDASWPRVVQKKKPEKLQKPASVLGVWQAFWKPPRKDLSCTSLRRACVSMDSIGSRLPARASRPLHHHGPRPAPMTKRTRHRFAGVLRLGRRTNTG